MRKAQENFKFLKFFISLTLILYTILIFNLHTFFIHVFIYYPVISIVIPVWLLTFLSFSSNKIFGVKVRKETKHKIVFYSIFLTFLLLYFGLLPNFGQLILATTTIPPTTTTTIPQCTSLTLTPSSGPPGYTVTPSVAYSTCKICDYQGCSGSSCKGTQISTDNNPFTAPSSPGTYGYYACPGGGYATITVTQPTTTTTSTTTSTTSTTSTTTSTTTSSTTTTTTTTTTLPPCSCSRCDFYSSSNCDNACSEWQNCTTTTCSASGCISNLNCYKCEWKPCSQVSPKVYILTPFIASGGDLTVSVYFECNQWSSSAKNLTLSLKIDGNDWNECFLNKKGLMTDFGWDSNCNNTMSRNCGSNNQWSCDSQAYCKHQNYDLWVKSNFNNHYVNVTFTCKLPYLTGGTHYLNVTATVYSNEVTLKPTTITFRIEETDGRKILEILSFPIKILRNLLPF